MSSKQTCFMNFPVGNRVDKKDLTPAEKYFFDNSAASSLPLNKREQVSVSYLTNVAKINGDFYRTLEKPRNVPKLPETSDHFKFRQENRKVSSDLALKAIRHGIMVPSGKENKAWFLYENIAVIVNAKKTKKKWKKSAATVYHADAMSQSRFLEKTQVLEKFLLEEIGVKSTDVRVYDATNSPIIPDPSRPSPDAQIYKRFPTRELLDEWAYQTTGADAGFFIAHGINTDCEEIHENNYPVYYSENGKIKTPMSSELGQEKSFELFIDFNASDCLFREKIEGVHKGRIIEEAFRLLGLEDPCYYSKQTTQDLKATLIKHNLTWEQARRDKHESKSATNFKDEITRCTRELRLIGYPHPTFDMVEVGEDLQKYLIEFYNGEHVEYRDAPMDHEVLEDYKYHMRIALINKWYKHYKHLPPSFRRPDWDNEAERIFEPLQEWDFTISDWPERRSFAYRMQERSNNDHWSLKSYDV